MSATGALFRNEARLMARTPASVIFIVGLPVLAAIVLAAIPAARRPSPEFGGLSVSQAYTPVIVLFAITMAALIVLPQLLGSYREMGYLRRLRTTPVAARDLLAALFWLTALVSVLVAVIIVVVPLVFGVEPPRQPLLLALGIGIAIVVFLALGVLLAALIPNPRVATGVGNVVAMVMWFCAGMWFPRALFPDWLGTITDLTPGGASAALINAATAGAGLTWTPIVVCAVWFVGSLALARWLFRWE